MSKETILKYQNRQLVNEMKCYKSQLQDAHVELDTLRRKSREMETFVSVVQRAWSQVSGGVLVYWCIELYVLYTI